MAEIATETKPDFSSLIEKFPQYVEDELQELWSAFIMFDKDNNGEIDKEELKLAMSSLAGDAAPNEEELDQLFDAADVDGNGVIDFSEFLTMMPSTTKDADDSRLRDTFRQFDENGDGFIDAKDLFNAIRGLGDLETTEKEIEKMIKVADSNNDGLVDYEEFKRMMMNVE